MALDMLNEKDFIELEQKSVSKEPNYILYQFKIPTLKKQDKIKYLVFTVLNNAVLRHLSVYFYGTKKTEYSIYNINYMKEEVLNKTTLSKHKAIFIFILENKELEKNKLIRIKINKEFSSDILMQAVGFKERPTTEEELNKFVSFENLPIENQTKDEDFTIHEVSFKNPEVYKQKYLAIFIFLNESVDFLSFYFGPES